MGAVGARGPHFGERRGAAPLASSSRSCGAERLQVGAGTTSPAKAPGARGGAPAHGEECRGRGAAPPRIGVCRGAQPLARFEAEARGEKGGKYKREEPNGSSLLS